VRLFSWQQAEQDNGVSLPQSMPDFDKKFMRHEIAWRSNPFCGLVLVWIMLFEHQGE